MRNRHRTETGETMKTLTLTAALALTLATSAFATDRPNPDVGGAPMFADRNIVQNAVNSADHTTLVAAVQAAGLVDALQGAGPFTVLAPVNAAFAALPAGTVESLLMPENLDTLRTVLTCHVIPARALSGDIVGMIEAGRGSHTVTTLGGCQLTLTRSGNDIVIADPNGGTATVTIADVRQSNGVIHVIDSVLLPAM
jgi:uncharacterized surface protein with fasciclin (FAS1) repeats